MTTAAGMVLAEFERAVHNKGGESNDSVRNGRLVVVQDLGSLSRRFWSKVDKDRPGGCWEWMGAKNEAGYGTFVMNRTQQPAHRVAWVLLRGPIPDGFHIDHLCKNPPCVNPEHLEPVTPEENKRRGSAWLLAGQKNARKTHCPLGHPYDDVNTLHLSGGRRDCRTCNRSGTRASKRSKTHCPAGHEFTPENTFLDSSRWRRCLTCRRARDRERNNRRCHSTHVLPVGVERPPTFTPTGSHPK